MKFKIILMVFSYFFLSCSFYHKSTLDSSIQTHVVLSKDNYKIIGSISGYAEIQYLLFLPLNTENLYQKAKEDMMKNANVYNFPKAIINITTDLTQYGLFPFYYSEICRMSGDVVYFTEGED